MPTLVEHHVATVSGFANAIETFAGSTQPAEIWYRGCGEASYKLQPKLYRRNLAAGESFQTLEESISRRFRERGAPFASRVFDEGWEDLFFMQHYGVPTRLLDWSENPFIALFFALTTGSVIQDAAVWAIDPAEWNKNALHHLSFEGGVLSANSSKIKSYAPSASWGDMGTQPVAIFGTHNSVRIVAQRGVFVLFGQNVTPMEEAYVNSGYGDGALQKIVVRASDRAQLLSAIIRLGYVDSVVYPDFDGLAREIRRRYGYEV